MYMNITLLKSTDLRNLDTRNRLIARLILPDDYVGHARRSLLVAAYTGAEAFAAVDEHDCAWSTYRSSMAFTLLARLRVHDYVIYVF